VASLKPLGFVGLALATFAVAGCTSTVSDGIASPIATAAGSAAQSSKASGLPQRPSELAIAGVDPCSLLTSAQLDELAVNSKPRQVADPVDGPSCSFDVDQAQPYYAYGITTVTSADLDAWLTGNRRKNSMTTQPMSVEGFPALRSFRQNTDPTDCETLVGVAHGQTLVVQAVPTTGGAFTQGQLCDLATKAATFAVQTLKAK
jgi:Protein of unknown function (DUF3558)